MGTNTNIKMIALPPFLEAAIQECPHARDWSLDMNPKDNVQLIVDIGRLELGPMES